MKNRTTIVIASLVTACSAGIAMADGIVYITGAPVGSKYDGSIGGTFAINRVSGDVGSPNVFGGVTANQFLTFCIEPRAALRSNINFYAQIATSSAHGTNSNDTANTNPLSSITAKLYREFTDQGDFGRVGSFANGYTTTAQTDAIQNAIWAAQGQVAVSSLTGDSLALYNWAKSNQNGLKGVRVLRLWANSSGGVYSVNIQDQLTMIPLPPAAWAGLGTLGCLLGASHIRRRKLAAA